MGNNDGDECAATANWEVVNGWRWLGLGIPTVPTHHGESEDMGASAERQ